MKPLTVGKEIKWMPTGIAARRRERIFYIGIAIVIVGVVFGGFARTYFLRPYFHTQPLLPVVLQKLLRGAKVRLVLNAQAAIPKSEATNLACPTASFLSNLLT